MIPAGNHTDWIWPLSLIPRRLTSIESKRPPRKIFGNVLDTDHLDVPPKGKWVIALPLHWAWTTKVGDINRISFARYDYNGEYYQILSLRLGSVTRRLKMILDWLVGTHGR
jgi:hypothetical protein